MKQLQQLIDAYKAMDDRAKSELLEEAIDLAKRWPAPRQEPRLRLVVSNTKN